jgi:predicted nucleic acid-binding protein
MPLPYIDRNVLVRYIARDQPAHAARARALLERPEDGSHKGLRADLEAGEEHC